MVSTTTLESHTHPRNEVQGKQGRLFGFAKEGLGRRELAA